MVWVLFSFLLLQYWYCKLFSTANKTFFIIIGWVGVRSWEDIFKSFIVHSINNTEHSSHIYLQRHRHPWRLSLSFALSPPPPPLLPHNNPPSPPPWCWRRDPATRPRSAGGSPPLCAVSSKSPREVGVARGGTRRQNWRDLTDPGRRGKKTTYTQRSYLTSYPLSQTTDEAWETRFLSPFFSFLPRS